MCGIAGGIWRDGRLVDETLARGALTQLQHRGPDAEGIHLNRGVFLGHQRLSIIDLDPRANQPMRSGSLVISFNGEIYNYRELRRSLEQKGISFTTESDTEVVLAAFREEGLLCLERLDGMFAFAIWDESARTLTLARDRFGEKPLPYFQDGEQFLFASEVPALEALVGRDRLEVDPAAMGLYFLFSYIPAPHTPYRRMRQLEPGTWLQFDAASWSVRSGRYYDLGQREQRAPGIRFDDAVAELRQRLTNSVRLRLTTADVPVAAFLSGGIDSSIIAAIAAEESPTGIRAYSVAFPEDPDFDEAPFARLVAQRYPGIRHTVVEVTERKLADFTERTLSALGEPFADASIIPTAFLCAHVEEKVILGGDGADELFAGYGVYAAMWASARLPAWLRRLALLLPSPGNPHGIRNPLLRAAGLFRSHLGETPLDEYLSWRCYASPRQLSSLGVDASGMATIHDTLAAVPMDTLRDLLMADIRFNLPNDMLKKVDLASMQHSLEVRLPYLDSGLVEFSLGLPEDFLMAGGERKRILRAAFRDRLPADILSRRKRGFLLPIRQWFRTGAIREEFSALAERQGLLDRTALRQLASEHERGGHDHSVLLWSCYVFLKWQDRQ